LKKILPLLIAITIIVCGCAVPSNESDLSGNSSTPNFEAASSLTVTSVASSAASTVSKVSSSPSTVSKDIDQIMTQADFNDFMENVFPQVIILIGGAETCDPNDSIEIDGVTYYKITDKKYNTVEKLKAEFAKYFTDEYVNEDFSSFFESGKPYKEKDGIIYSHVDDSITTFEVAYKDHYSDHEYVDSIYLSSVPNKDHLYFYFNFTMVPNIRKWKIGLAQYGIVQTTPAKKPVLYLYPETVTDVTVTLDLNGTLGCTYPAYPKDGWKVTAYPNGKLIVGGEEYNYLFWEGNLNTVFTFDKGFCVKGSDTAAFLKKALSEMGLIPSEYNDFIVCWLPQMEKNAFNLISFAHVSYTDNAKLEITPKPNSTLRVFMIFKPLQKPVTIAPQTFEKFERNGFTVVEWGGAEID